MPFPMPAVSLAAVPGRRRAMLDLAREIERRGFSGIYCASFGDGMALCEALALVTERIEFGTSIQPIYTRNVHDFAQMAAFIHELSGGRFRFGVGVSHEPALARLGVRPGKPVDDMKAFIEGLRGVQRVGDLPPLVIAALRKRMIRLGAQAAEGIVFANAALSHMRASLASLPPEKQKDPGFFIGNMIPTCISNDIEAAKAVNRKTLSGYVLLPNYRNYWKEAGYEDEMNAIEKALQSGERARIPELLSDRWLADTTLFGPAAAVRAGLEAWYAAGVRTPILVPSSAIGNQMKAFEELFEALCD